jgi:hypothetical protein
LLPAGRRTAITARPRSSTRSALRASRRPTLTLTFNRSSDTDEQRHGDWFDPDVKNVVFGFINGWYQGGPGDQDDLDALTSFCLNGNQSQGCACGAVVNAFRRIHSGDCR